MPPCKSIWLTEAIASCKVRDQADQASSRAHCQAQRTHHADVTHLWTHKLAIIGDRAYCTANVVCRVPSFLSHRNSRRVHFTEFSEGI